MLRVFAHCGSGPACVLCTQHGVVRLDGARESNDGAAGGWGKTRRTTSCARSSFVAALASRERIRVLQSSVKNELRPWLISRCKGGGEFLTATRTRCNTPRGNTRRCDQAVARHGEPASFSSFGTACVRNGSACRDVTRVFPTPICSTHEAHHHHHRLV